MDLKRETRETVLNNFDEDMNAKFTLFLGGRIIRTGQMPGKRARRRDIGPICSAYGPVPISGIRIC
jgi:hypothetical protein